MRNVLFRARESFARDQRGNVAILFAFTAIPLIALLGGAVDVTRHQRHEMALLNAMDAATIALVRQGELSDAEADKFVNDFIGAMVDSKDDPMLHMASFDATKIEGGYRVSSKGTMDTAFLPVVGMDKMSINLSTEVMESTGKYEIALALDNTGSMDDHGRIEALRDAAGQLVDDLYKEPGTEDRVEMALIPFVTAVNIKSTEPGVFKESWIDYVGPSEEIDGKKVYGFNFIPAADGKPVNRDTLFKRMGVQWKGCVEARAGALGEDDTLPDDHVTGTRWVPYLWPDEPDRGYGNSYLTDVTTGGTSGWDLLRNTDKYAVPRGTRVSDTTSKGPNAACPRAIVELTNDKDRMHNEIDLMKPHNPGSQPNNSGTNVAEGLAWAWRVLSPDEPYDQGAKYEDKETTKVLVLLSDGRNWVLPNGGVTKSDYTSYGYLAAGRLGTTQAKAEDAIDDKVSRICAAVKEKGIRVYTILFQVDFDETQDLFRECASKDDNGEPLYFYVPDAGSLETAFAEIGEDLTSLRVAR